jgi:hypothetical protein
MRTVAADKPLGVDDFFAPIRVAELCLDTTSDRLEADQLDLPLDHNPKRLKVRRKKTFGIALWDHQTKVVGTCDMIKAVERQYGPRRSEWTQRGRAARHSETPPCSPCDPRLQAFGSRQRGPWRFRSGEDSYR